MKNIFGQSHKTTNETSISSHAKFVITSIIISISSAHSNSTTKDTLISTGDGRHARKGGGCKSMGQQLCCAPEM